MTKQVMVNVVVVNVVVVVMVMKLLRGLKRLPRGPSHWL